MKVYCFTLNTYKTISEIEDDSDIKQIPIDKIYKEFGVNIMMVVVV